MHIGDITLMHTRFGLSTDGVNVSVAKLSARVKLSKLCCSVSDHVNAVFDRRVVSKVVETIVLLVAVIVENKAPVGTRTDERCCDKPLYKEDVPGKCDL